MTTAGEKPRGSRAGAGSLTCCGEGESQAGQAAHRQSGCFRADGAPAALPAPPTHSTGVVLEGGGFRGMYTAGVLDVWMEHGITATHTVGVSAGATFGCNFKSLQIGRTLRYNKKYCADPRYASVRNLILTGDLFSRDFAYDKLVWELDPFDVATFQANPMRFTIVANDINTGEAVYHDLARGDREDVAWIRASASIPALSRPVHLDGRELLDGGTADSIPFEWMLAQGYERCVVVCTQDASYRKEPNEFLWFLKMRLRRYPKLVELLANRHERYNRQREAVKAAADAGKLFLIMPSEPIKLPTMVKDPELLEQVYQLGRRDAHSTLDALKAYLA